MELPFESPLGLSMNELGEAITLCFEGYVVPIQMNGALVGGIVRVDSVDLASSLLLRDDEGPLAVALIARRDKICRLALMAVAKRARRQGLGRGMLERALQDARQRGDEAMVLEVIEQNPGAVALYESAGFTKVDRLIGSSVKLGPGSGVEGKDVVLSRVAAVIRDNCRGGTAWQASAASVEQMSSPTFGFEHDGVYSAVGPAGDEMAVCRALGWITPNLGGWLEAVATRFPGRTLRVPPIFRESVFGKEFEAAGLAEDGISQFEMKLDL